MTERPILFSGPMVRAILDGRKTQTRRVIKPQPPSIAPSKIECDHIGCGEGGGFGFFDDDRDYVCPYGQPGDRLWVREKWGLWHPIEKCCLPTFEYEDYDKETHQAKLDPTYSLRYASDGAECERWRPSIHMPRWASRITLEITGIRVERVQEISEADAMAEGVDREPGTYSAEFKLHGYVSAFATLWDLINAKRGYGIDSNPWVWVVEFRRV